VVLVVLLLVDVVLLLVDVVVDKVLVVVVIDDDVEVDVVEELVVDVVVEVLPHTVLSKKRPASKHSAYRPLAVKPFCFEPQSFSCMPPSPTDALNFTAWSKDTIMVFRMDRS